MTPNFLNRESEEDVRTRKEELLGAEIKSLGRATILQIDRMEESKSRISILTQAREHAEKMVYERAEREIRLQAEIEALHQAALAQMSRIEAAEAQLNAQAEEQRRATAEALQRVEDEERKLAEEQHELRKAVESRARALTEARERAASEEFEQLADDSRRAAEEEEQRLAHLESIRTRAEAASQQRAERERQLNAQLLAFSEAAAEQLKRIEKAEADLVEAKQTLLELEEKASQASEYVATQLAETAERRQRAEAQWAETEAEVRVVAEQNEGRLAELQQLRAESEAEAEKRAEAELKLKADLESLANAERAQRNRLEHARSQIQRLSEEESRLRRIAEEEEERMVELESLRDQAEHRVQHRSEEERQLRAEIEALNQIEADQLNRIADAEVDLLVREEELQNADLKIYRQEANGSGADSRSQNDPQHSPTASPAATDPIGSTVEWSMINEAAAKTTTEESLCSANDEVTELAVGDTTEPPEVRTSTDVDETFASFPSTKVQEESSEGPSPLSLAERLKTASPSERRELLEELTRLEESVAFTVITDLFDDDSEEVRNVAARALYDLNPSRADTFTRALREASTERRRQIIRALDSSGIAAEAIECLAGESREKTYDAFSVLFLMAKAGEVQTLLHTIEKHSNSAVRLSVIKLLTFSNRPDVIPPLRSLAVRGALPIEVRSALMESIYEISSNARERALSAA
jgi:hypothetical protein